MRILGYINAFDELADADRRLGRKVANYGMVAALLEYSSFDELHFFLPFFGALRPFEEGYARWLKADPERQRVKLLPAVALPGLLERTPYTAIHGAELERYFPELCHLRNRWALEPFPITCTPHTLCYWSTQVRNLYKVMPGPQPYDSIFCTSRAAREHLGSSMAASAARLRQLGMTQAGYGGRLDVAPLGVRCADFGRLERLQAQAALGLEPGPLTLLCLGRLTPRDKADLTPFIGALSRLNRQHPLRLVLAGAQEQGYGQQLVKLANQMGLEGRVIFYNEFDSNLKATILSAADIFVSLADNLQETFGLVILEAMASGLPVVASDFSGYRDLVTQGESGFLIPTWGPADFGPLDPVWPILAEHVAALQVSQRTAVDMDILAARLGELAASPQLRARMGQAGRERAEQLFDWSVVVRRMETLWLELKSLARSLEPGPAPLDVLGAGLGEIFGHFPSQVIGQQSLLKAGSLSQDFLEGRWARHNISDLAQALPSTGLERILGEIGQAGGQLSLSALEQRLAGQMQPYQVEHLSLWGLKYGVLALG